MKVNTTKVKDTNGMEIATEIKNKIIDIVEKHCGTLKKQKVDKNPNLIRVELRDWDFCLDRANYQLNKSLPVLSIHIEKYVYYQIEPFFKEMITTDYPLIKIKENNFYYHQTETHDGVSWGDSDNTLYHYKFSWVK